MKKWIYTLSLLGALAVGANADVITHVKPTSVDGCYQITNAGELFGFADIVNGIPADAENGIEEVPAQPNVCGKLVNDIRIIKVAEPYADGYAKDYQVVKVDLSDHILPEENIWTPMINFAGSFDGQGHTISGLYYSGSNAGFFASLTGNATVRRLRIEDSYFEADDAVGGFAAKVNGNEITIEECYFKGLIQNATTKGAGVFIGGIVGNLDQYTRFEMNLCTNEGAIQPNTTNSKGYAGGLIGFIKRIDASSLTITNCYGQGFVSNKPQYSIVGTIKQTKNITNSNVYCYGTGDLCKVKIDCSANQETCVALQKKQIVENLNNAGFQGMSFEFNEAGHIIIAHITEWSNPQTKNTVLPELVIPQSVIADSVTFDRIFNGKTATIMLPFDIPPSNITDASGNAVYFNAVPTLNYTEGKWVAEAGTETDIVEAHTPYIVDYSKTDSIYFHGPVTLKQTKNKEHSTKINNNWSLVGTYKTMNTTTVSDDNVNAGTSEYEKESNLGKIYGFVGTADVSDNGYDFTLGEFAVAGHNVRTREMRAYLIYKDNTPSPASAPAYNGMPMLRTAPAVEESPSRIPVIYNAKTIVPVGQFVDPTLKTTKVVATIKIDIPEIECEKDCEEGTTAITKPFMIPVKASKIGRWQDAMGRSLNGKPTKRGSYFKNGIPVIIK